MKPAGPTGIAAELIEDVYKARRYKTEAKAQNEGCRDQGRDWDLIFFVTEAEAQGQNVYGLLSVDAIPAYTPHNNVLFWCSICNTHQANLFWFCVLNGAVKPAILNFFLNILSFFFCMKN